MSAHLIARLIGAGAPAALVAEVAMDAHLRLSRLQDDRLALARIEVR